MSRTPLLAIIAMLPLFIWAQRPAADPDSVYLKRFVREVKMANVESDKAEKMSDSQLDKELKEMGMAVMPSGFIASPDGSFKIFQAEMEFCGAYCHPEWVSRILWFSGSDTIVEVMNLFAVKEIHALGSHHYLLLSQGADRPAGFYTVSIEEAVVIILEENRIMETDAFYPALDITDNTFPRLTQVQEMDVNMEQEMTFDPEAGTISYAYGFAHNMGVSELTTEEKGLWKWSGHLFMLVERSQRLGRLGQ